MNENVQGHRRIVTLGVIVTGLLWVGSSPGLASATFQQNTPSIAKISTPPNWARYAATCNPPGGEELLSCGTIGKYQLQSGAPIPGCVIEATGYAALLTYPRQIVSGGGGPVFGSAWAAAAAQAHAEYLHAGSSSAGDPWTSELPGGEIGPGGTEEREWIAMVDFDDEHGWSTSFLTASIAGPTIETELIPLDQPDSDPFGSNVNDFHVLRALCSIVDRIEQQTEIPPKAINMSFGRLKSPGEPWFPASCRSGRFGCQIAQVIGSLKQVGVKFFGAAGNHGELLFPGGLPDITTVGALDLHSLRGEGVAQGVWENPPGIEALAPGGHLCLDDGWSAPSGTSYSSAILAGWTAGYNGEFDSGENVWVPVWDEAQQCYSLSDGTNQIGACNPGVTAIFESLDGTRPNPCWDQGSGQPVAAIAPGSGPQPPDVPSFDHWAAFIHPTPSGDPCVPCNGLSRVDEPDLLEVNLSGSRGLDPDVYIINVYLKALGDFVHVPLAPDELEAIRAGTLDRLDLSGFDLTDPDAPQPSLWFELSDEPNPDCAVGGHCFWTASDILIELDGL